MAFKYNNVSAWKLLLNPETFREASDIYKNEAQFLTNWLRRDGSEEKFHSNFEEWVKDFIDENYSTEFVVFLLNNDVFSYNTLSYETIINIVNSPKVKIKKKKFPVDTFYERNALRDLLTKVTSREKLRNICKNQVFDYSVLTKEDIKKVLLRSPIVEHLIAYSKLNLSLLDNDDIADSFLGKEEEYWELIKDRAALSYGVFENYEIPFVKSLVEEYMKSEPTRVLTSKYAKHVWDSDSLPYEKLNIYDVLVNSPMAKEILGTAKIDFSDYRLYMKNKIFLESKDEYVKKHILIEIENTRKRFLSKEYVAAFKEIVKNEISEVSDKTHSKQVKEAFNYLVGELEIFTDLKQYMFKKSEDENETLSNILTCEPIRDFFLDNDIIPIETLTIKDFSKIISKNPLIFIEKLSKRKDIPKFKMSETEFKNNFCNGISPEKFKLLTDSGIFKEWLETDHFNTIDKINKVQSESYQISSKDIRVLLMNENLAPAAFGLVKFLNEDDLREVLENSPVANKVRELING